jgi:hypothetical protein
MKLVQTTALCVIAVSQLACQQGSAGVFPAVPGISSPSRPAIEPVTTVGSRDPGDWGAEPAGALLLATGDLQLTDAQQSTIVSLERRIEVSDRDRGEAFIALHAELAAEVRAGVVDSVRVQAAARAAADGLDAFIATEAVVIDELHAALGPSQRKTVVATVRAEPSGRAEMQAGGGPGLEPTATERAKEYLDRLTRDLQLDEAQQIEVSDVLAAQPSPPPFYEQERDRRRDALLILFERGTFDAKTAVPVPASWASDIVKAGMAHETALVSALLPLLKPDQRDRLAVHIESRGSHTDRGDE